MLHTSTFFKKYTHLSVGYVLHLATVFKPESTSATTYILTTRKLDLRITPDTKGRQHKSLRRRNVSHVIYILQPDLTSWHFVQCMWSLLSLQYYGALAPFAKNHLVPKSTHISTHPPPPPLPTPPPSLPSSSESVHLCLSCSGTTNWIINKDLPPLWVRHGENTHWREGGGALQSTWDCEPLGRLAPWPNTPRGGKFVHPLLISVCTARHPQSLTLTSRWPSGMASSSTVRGTGTVPQLCPVD